MTPPSHQSPAPDLAELQGRVEGAAATYRSAAIRAVEARHAETDALDALNEAQRALDEGVVELRDRAPAGSDWKRAGQRAGL